MSGHGSGLRPLAMDDAEDWEEEEPSTPRRARAKIWAVFCRVSTGDKNRTAYDDASLGRRVDLDVVQNILVYSKYQPDRLETRS